MIERERLEDKGIGDQMASLQQTHPPWKRIQDETLKRIEMCFSMTDGTLIWSQGSIKVVKDMSEKRDYIEVDVTWDKSCLAKGAKRLHPRKRSRNGIGIGIQTNTIMERGELV